MKKKYSFLLFLLFVALHLSAQQHLVLIEEFTNTGCNPCASWSPELDQVIEDRLGECIAIKYHSGYPDSSDEYYNYDKLTQQTRLDYYGVTGVPTTFVNGVEIGERTTEMMHYAIDYFLAQSTPYTLSVSKQITGRHLSAHTVLSSSTAIDNTTDLRLFVAVIEEHIIADKPYPNGETHLKKSSRIKAFVFKFISVPAKWIRTSRHYELNIYTSNHAYKNAFAITDG